ncbi:MAG: DUF4976 domain-containing protein, partial [Candidatus Solibacter sp.]|nr:DUF4976 domain-containing protein [Candidatus Solibacter sp.]
RHKDAYRNEKFVPPPTMAADGDMARGRPRWVRDQRNSWHGVDFPYHSALDIEGYYKRYCETLSGVDDSLGRVMAQLRKMSIADETLVIYMGDNGFMFGEHGLIDKRVAYEASIRVPLLLRCPELFPGGTVITQSVANIDIAPTVLAAAAIAPPPHMDGRSFLPLAQGRTIPWREHFLYVYYWEKNYPQTPTTFAIRGERYKYITYYGLWDADELYDLQNDPQETKNLLYEPRYHALARDLESRLYTMMAELGGMEIPLNAPLGESNNKRLRTRGGERAADFPAPFVVEQPIHQNAR